MASTGPTSLGTGKGPLYAPLLDAIPLLSSLNSVSQEPATIYPSRWYIVAVYSLFASTQGMIFSIPGVIAGEMQSLYGIDGNTIQLLLAYGPICYILFSIPFGWHMDRYGVRLSVLIATTCVLLSCIFRCFASSVSTQSLVLLHAGYIFNGIAGPVAMAAVGKISEDWFPPNQRTTATAIMAEANLFGGCIVFPIATYAVTSASAQEMLNLDLICAGLAAAAWIGAILYFPSHPPTPPSASAASQQNLESRLGFKQLGRAVVRLMTDRHFLLLSISYGVCNGMATIFGALLTVDVGTIGMAQTMAGWLGFVASLGGSFGGIILARYSDKKRNQRGALLWMLFLAGICFAVFAIVVQGVFPASFTQGNAGLAVLFISATLGGLFCDSAVPLFFELSMEITFPLPESTVLMLMTLLNNVATLPPLFVPLDTFGVAWINWAYSAVLLVSTVVLFLFYKNAAPRYDFDSSHTVASVLKEAALEAEADEFNTVQTTLGELEGQLTLDRTMVRTI